MNQILVVENLAKKVTSQGDELTILSDISFNVNEGDSVAIVGASGSGKSTLLSLLAGLDVATQGDITFAGQKLSEMDEEARAALRASSIGFVFQSFMLVHSLTALENVMLPAELAGKANAKQEAEQLLEKVGLGHRLTHYPSQLSGGEQQRVAIARAFVGQPKVLFADEPSANLDTKNGHLIEDLLFELNKAHNTTLVLVTHDEQLAAKCKTVLHIDGGQLVDVVTGANYHVG